MPFSLERAGEDEPNDGLTLEGHAAVFGAGTLINSWEGRFTEEIAPGAFKKTFRERTPVLQFDHGHHPLIGSLPIGKIKEAREDEVGAFVSARLHDNWLVQPVRDAIEEESVTGMSFRFSVVREEWRDKDDKLIRDDDTLLLMLWDDSDYPKRLLRELKVPELGPVVFPAYETTDVSVRSGSTVIDLSRFLQSDSNRRTVARALFAAERATLGHSPVSTPQSDDAPAEGDDDESTPREAAPAPDTPSVDDPTAAEAERMRARLTQLSRST